MFLVYALHRSMLINLELTKIIAFFMVFFLAVINNLIF